MPYCPHCKRDGMAEAHIERCPDNPPLNAAIRAALTDQTNPRYAIGSDAYGRRAKHCGVPAETTISIHYGSWVNAVEAFGLIPASEKPRRETPQRKPFTTRKRKGTDTAACVYCGNQYRTGGFIDKHEQVCPQRPGIMELVLTIVEDTPGVGVDVQQYQSLADAYNASKPDGAPAVPGMRALTGHFGGWAGVLHHIGLITPDEAIDAKSAADNARYRAAWQEHHAHELDSWGLPVASVQKPDPRVRRLPSGGTATMIR